MSVELVEVDEQLAHAQLELSPGPHVTIVVADTGHGMDAELRSHIFEPFFTTKGPGQGTGLGLATVFGIVKQSGGSIAVDSEPGVGSTFKLYFPATSEPDVPVAARPTATRAVIGQPLVLVVEDEQQVRRVIVELLQRAGYRVIEAEDGETALQRIATLDDRVDLLVTDLVMPGIGGKQLADRVNEQLGDVPVLFTSGYAEGGIVRAGVLEDNVQFLAKPIVAATLLDAVAAALG